MEKFNKVLINGVIIGLLIVVIVILLKGKTSGYKMLQTVAGPTAKANPPSIFDLKVGMNCTAGPGEKAEYYSQGLAAGGLCGSSEYVLAQERDYTIADGIGGSLLEK